MKFIKSGFILTIAVLLAACGGNAKKESLPAEDTDKKTVAAGSYSNDRMGYSITYPKDVLLFQSDTENADEQVFLQKDGDGKLRIFKDVRQDKKGNVLDLAAAYEVDKTSTKDHQVVYSSFQTISYSLSGVEGKEIFYQKTIKAKGGLVTAKITYTKEQKDIFDPMLLTLFGSFK